MNMLDKITLLQNIINTEEHLVNKKTILQILNSMKLEERHRLVGLKITGEEIPYREVNY